MSATNDTGSEKYWYNGDTVQGVKNDSVDTGSEKYWFNGDTVQQLFVTTTVNKSSFFMFFD